MVRGVARHTRIALAERRGCPWLRGVFGGGRVTKVRGVSRHTRVALAEKRRFPWRRRVFGDGRVAKVRGVSRHTHVTLTERRWVPWRRRVFGGRAKENYAKYAGIGGRCVCCVMSASAHPAAAARARGANRFSPENPGRLQGMQVIRKLQGRSRICEDFPLPCWHLAARTERPTVR